jgi:hypothetical protein
MCIVTTVVRTIILSLRNSSRYSENECKIIQFARYFITKNIVSMHSIFRPRLTINMDSLR